MKEELFEKRKQVIRLYKQGTPIMKIVEECDLSWPAVNVAIKLYEKGGVNALQPEQRGRKQGTGRTLGADQETEIRTILYRKRPWQVGIHHSPMRSLWNRAAVMQLVQQQYGIKLSARGVSKYLQRWGFLQTKQNQRPKERCTREIQEWLQNHYGDIAKRCDTENVVIYWVSKKPLDVSNSVKSGWPRRMYQISVTDNHRKEHWMIITGNYSQEKQIKFLKSLVHQSRKHIILIRDNSDHYTERQVDTWIQQNTNIDVYPPLLPGEIKKKEADRERAVQVREELRAERAHKRDLSELHRTMDAIAKIGVIGPAGLVGLIHLIEQEIQQKPLRRT